MRYFGLVLVAASAFSADGLARERRLSEEHRRWLEEEVVYIILDREREVFSSLDTEEQRSAFIDAFWDKRDPYPATLENEYRTEHYRRIAHANDRFSREAPMPGWRTDRGRYYIILGEPASVQGYDGLNQVVSSELWFYNGDPGDGLPSRFNLLFFRDYEVGHYQLYHPSIHGPSRLLRAGSSPSLIADENRAMDILTDVSPELAIAALSIDLTEMSTTLLSSAAAASFRAPGMSTDATLANIAQSPGRRVDTGDLDGFVRYGDRVSAEYSFRFVPSRFDASVLPGPDKTPFVHFILELDPRDFTVEDDGTGRFHTTLDVGVEIRDSEGHVIAMDHTVPLEIAASALGEVATLPFAYEDDFPVAVPGNYRMSVTLKNRMTKQFTVAEVDIDVPSFAASGVSGLSDVVLAYREERVDDAYLTYQLDGVRMHPAIGGFFAVGDTVLAFTVAAGATAEHRVRFSIVDGDDVLTTGETRDAGGLVSVPLSLAGFVGGSYRLEAELVDGGGEVVAERARTITVSPRSSIPRAGLVYRQGFYAEVPGLLSLARGEQLLVIGRVDDAIGELERAVAANNPKLAIAKWKLATALVHARDADRALEILLPLAGEHPDQYEVVEGLGLTYYLKGNPEAAIPHLERAMEIRSPDVVVLNALGWCYRDAGRDDDAKALFVRSLELDPNQTALREWLSSAK